MLLASTWSTSPRKYSLKLRLTCTSCSCPIVKQTLRLPSDSLKRSGGFGTMIQWKFRNSLPTPARSRSIRMTDSGLRELHLDFHQPTPWRSPNQPSRAPTLIVNECQFCCFYADNLQAWIARRALQVWGSWEEFIQDQQTFWEVLIPADHWHVATCSCPIFARNNPAGILLAAAFVWKFLAVRFHWKPSVWFLVPKKSEDDPSRHIRHLSFSSVTTVFDCFVTVLYELHDLTGSHVSLTHP